MTLANDRRFMPRVRWDVDIAIEIGGQRLPCRCIDISQTGVRVRGSWSAHRGQQVRLILPLEVGPVHASGEVIWASDADDEGWGIRFTSVQPVARRQIARFVIARLREHPQHAVGAPTTAATPSPAEVDATASGAPRVSVPWVSIRDAPLSRPEDPRTEPEPPRTPPWQQASTSPAPLRIELDRRPASEVAPAPSPPAAPVSSPAVMPRQEEPEPAPAEVLPCNPAMRSKLQALLDSGLASGSIVSGAKEAMSARGDLFLRVDTGPVVVLPGDDPLSGRLRWLAAAVATWSGSDEPRLQHGPDVPLTIRI